MLDYSPISENVGVGLKLIKEYNKIIIISLKMPKSFSLYVGRLIFLISGWRHFVSTDLFKSESFFY